MLTECVRDDGLVPVQSTSAELEVPILHYVPHGSAGGRWNKFRKGELSVTIGVMSRARNAQRGGTLSRMRFAVQALLVLLLSGCAFDGVLTQVSSDVEPDAAAPTRVAAGAACMEGSVRTSVYRRRALAAVVERRAVAYRKPGGKRIESFGARNVNGVATVFGVLARQLDRRCRTTWYRVQLPMKPNGIAGWVRASAVRVVPVTTRIEVDISERRVTLFDRGRRVLTTRAAIGSAATPTPTGRYYVNQRLIPDDTSGPFGPGAIGISAFSEVLTGWVQGGPIAIHGTNRPDLIGRAVSNGCIRIANDVLVRLFDRTLAGTPVLVSE